MNSHHPPPENPTTASSLHQPDQPQPTDEIGAGILGPDPLPPISDERREEERRAAERREALERVTEISHELNLYELCATPEPIARRGSGTVLDELD